MSQFRMRQIKRSLDDLNLKVREFDTINMDSMGLERLMSTRLTIGRLEREYENLRSQQRGKKDAAR